MNPDRERIGEAATDALSEAARESLLELLESDPQRLESYLLDAGDRTEGTTVSSAEETTEIPDLEARLERISDTDREFYEVFENIPKPMASADIVSYLSEHESEFVEQHRSANHEAWVTNRLTTLAKNGIVGKFRHGKQMLYTPDIYEAILTWKGMKRPMDDFTVDLVEEYAMETGMPYRVVRATVRQHHDL